MSGSQTTSLKLDTEMKERLQRLAGTRRRSAHWLMREAIVQYVDREEKREEFKQEALAAWAEYQRTGLHLTGEEVNGWLEKVAQGKKARLPKPHK
jgi:predicted transcriptional regulator